MESLEVRKILREDSHGETAIKSQRDGLNVNVWDTGNISCKDFQDEKMDTERGEAIKTLPDELVETILAMLPFPFVFQARILSKSWLARLSSTSSQDDEETKHLAVSFHKRIREWSINWKTFCPVFYLNSYWTCTTSSETRICSDASLDTFERTSNTWVRLSLSFLPEILREFSWSTKAEQIEGSLLLLSTESPSVNVWLESVTNKQLYVVNVLTQSWKELPPRPYGHSLGKTHLCHLGDKYKVIHFPDNASDQNLLEIYDSTAATWTSMKVISSEPDTQFYKNLNVSKVPSLDGVLYFVKLENRYNVDDRYCHFENVLVRGLKVRSLKVLALNVDEGTSSEQLNIVAEVMDSRLSDLVSVEIVICKVNLLVLILYMRRGDINVVKIDLLSRQWKVCAGHPYMKGMAPVSTAVSDGDFIFTYIRLDSDGNRALGIIIDGGCSDDDRVLAYNVHEDSWELLPYNSSIDTNRGERNPRDCYPRIGSSFRPGLNPFVVV